jgi:hypothetical protein
LIKIPGLANQIQRNIGKGYILLQDRTMPGPFAVAMSEDQGIVGQMKDIEGFIFFVTGSHV